MSHIEDVARLKTLEAKRQCVHSHTDRHYELKELLAVAGQFQDGDSRTLEDGISWLENLLEVKEIKPGAEDQCKELVRVIGCLRRMLAAARIMEGEQG